MCSAVGAVLGQHHVASGASPARHAIAGHAAGVVPSCSYAPSPQGYLQATALGDVLASGTARLYGTLMDRTINEPVVGLAGTPTGDGYWEAASDGGIFAFGDAGFHGSMGGSHLNQPIVGIAATPDGGGYWLVAADGGIFAFGDAGFHGSMGGSHLNQPIVGIAATPDGGGYWLVAADGGIFAFGDAGFHGSMGGSHLNQPIVGIAATPDGGGYWLVAADGGIFAFGDAGFHGSMGGSHLNQPIVGIAATPDGGGYWLSGADSGIFTFGDASFQGSFAGGLLPSSTVGIVGIPATANGSPVVPVQSGDSSIFQSGFDYYYASAGQYVNAAGASAQLCAADPGTNAADVHTVTEVAATFDQGGKDYVEIGIMSSSRVYGDLAPHLFVDHWLNGAYVECAPRDIATCGFVQVSDSIQPNMRMPVGISVSYAIEHVGHEWNLYLDGQLVGYFPDALWNNAFTSIVMVQLFGEVATNPGVTPSFIMGNGLYGHMAGADQVTGYQLLGQASSPAFFNFAYDSVPASYDIVATSTSFAYGGPGGSRGQSGPQVVQPGRSLPPWGP